MQMQVVVLRADASDADIAAACVHGLLLHRRELVRVCRLSSK